jgi:hypothetical protein
VELAGPLLTVMFFLPLEAASLAYAAAACALFLTHEPLLILLGRRGERTRHAAAPAASQRLGFCAAVGSASLLLGVALSNAQTSIAILFPVALSMVAALLITRNREKSLGGELLVAATLASFALPVALAAGLSMQWAGWLIVSWTSVHALSTLTARAIVYRKREGERLLTVACAGGVLLALAAPLLVPSDVPDGWAYAPLPFAGLLVLLRLGVFRPRSPKTLGWTLAVGHLVALVLFGVGLRGLT